MAKWTSPAESLMGRLSFPAKFGLVSVLFLIPLVLTLFLYLNGATKSVSLLKKELDGVKIVTLIEPLVVNIGQHRGITNAFHNGDTQLASAMSDKQREIDQSFDQVASELNVYDKPQLSRELSELSNKWQQLRAQSQSEVEAQLLLEQHNELANLIRLFVVAVELSFELTLDSDRQTTFLIDMVTRELPKVLDQAALVRDAASGVTAMGQFSPDTYIYLNNQANGLSDLVPLLQRMSRTELDFEHAEELKTELENAANAVSNYLQFVRSQVIDPDRIAVGNAEVYQQGDHQVKEIQKLYEHALPALDTQLSDRLAEFILHRNLILVVLFLTIGLAIYLFIGFYKYTILAIDSFSEGADQLAKGNLSIRLQKTGKDELAKVFTGFNNVAEGFQNLVKEAVRSTEMVSEGSSRLTTESSQTLNGVAQQKDEAVKIAEAAEILASKAEEISSSTSMAADSAAQADQMATEGKKVVVETAASFSGMMDEVAKTSEVIGQLDNDVQAIGDISGVIREIAEQTNLLALNAAIEAARAGDQGRGFAVVADEVRTLAQRTQESTVQIQQTIESLQDCTKSAVELMESSQLQVQSNVEEIRKAGDILTTIEDTVAEINQMNTQIAGAVQEQSSLVHELHGNTHAISSIADEASSSAQQTAQLAHEMADSSNQLCGSLQKFVID